MTSQVPAASRADIIPKTNRSGLPSNNNGSRIPFRTVDVTSPPAKNAPENSNIHAIKIAVLNVIAPDPTEVPIALATSFAPIPHAIINPAIAVSIRIGSANSIIICSHDTLDEFKCQFNFSEI